VLQNEEGEVADPLGYICSFWAIDGLREYVHIASLQRPGCISDPLEPSSEHWARVLVKTIGKAAQRAHDLIFQLNQLLVSSRVAGKDLKIII
jgi:hypothetical protein